MTDLFGRTYMNNKELEAKRIEDLIAKKSKRGIKLDIACGAHKQGEDWVGIDYLPYRGVVDIVHNIEITPWPLPDECVQTSIASHIFEHITPHFGDSRLEPLAQLLVDKNVISQDEKQAYMGDSGAVFLKMMNEIWRITKVGGQLAFVSPYSGSEGDFWDPTHINHINEVTQSYFDPEDKSHGHTMWKFYEPKPWKVAQSFWHVGGHLEVLLEKRPDVYKMVTLDKYVPCPNNRCPRKETNEMFVRGGDNPKKEYSCFSCGAVWPVQE